MSPPHDPSHDAPEAIQEKRLISELRQEFYASGEIPDDKFWWALSRKIVRRILADANSPKRQPATLFLRLHFPFFDGEVQSVLMERFAAQKENYWYPIEAYLIAEQFGKNAYGYSSSESLNLIVGPAQFFFTNDLHWFAGLLRAVSAAFENAATAFNPNVGSEILRLQGWNNRYSEFEYPHENWFKDTSHLQTLGKIQKRKSLAAKRVTASKENKRRKNIFKPWLPYWKAELHRLNLQPDSTSKR